MNAIVIIIICVVVITVLVGGILLYRRYKGEDYMLMKNIGKFSYEIEDDDDEYDSRPIRRRINKHKYSGHRYKDRIRSNQRTI